MRSDPASLLGRRPAAVISVAALCLAAPAPSPAQVAVRGKVVHTMNGAPIEDGVVVIRDGKVSAVGRAGDVNVPGGFRVLQAEVVTPGLVDAHATVGLSGQYNFAHDRDQLERSSAIQPELRAVDAYNPRDRLVEWVRSFGVTTVHTGHAPGELVSGQTMIVKTRGDTVEEALVEPYAAVAATLANDARKDGDRSPGTRGKMMAMLRARFLEAEEHARRVGRAGARDGDGGRDGDTEPPKDPGTRDAAGGAAKPPEPPSRDLALEALGDVLAGRKPLLVTAHRAQDIANTLRLAEEFSISLILDGAAEAYLLTDRIRAAGVPVVLHPTMARASGDLENLSFETAAKLRRAGIPVALQSGYESYVPKTRVVLFEAALAAANGLTFEEALRTVTIDAARILGIDGRVGSIAVGKDGDLALYDGDPFEYTTHCIATVIEGEVVSEGERPFREE